MTEMYYIKYKTHLNNGTYVSSPDKMELTTCEMVGYLVKEHDEYYVFAMAIDTSPLHKNYVNLQSVPKKMIVEKKRLIRIEECRN